MTIYKYYANILQKLGITIEQCPHVIRFLMDEDIDYFLKLYHSSDLHSINKFQTGGKSYIYEYDHNKFRIFEDIEQNATFFSIRNNSNRNGYSCVMLEIPTNQNHIIMHSIGKLEKCSLSDIPQKNIGTTLLKTALDFIKNNLKERFKLKYVELKDNSHVNCKSIKTNIDLDSLYMLTRGHTWYGKYGFLPCNPDDGTIHMENYKSYKHNQNIVNTIKIKDTNIGSYVINAVRKLKISSITDEQYEKFIKKHENDTVKEFLYYATIDRDRTCGIFGLIYHQIMRDLGIVNLHGISYSLQL